MKRQPFEKASDEQGLKRQDAKAPRSEPRDEIDGWARRVIGAAIEVHRDLGPGFLESVYEEALASELAIRGLKFQRQYLIPIEYKGRVIGEHKLDFLVEEELVVELKAVEHLLPIHHAQVHSYLKAGAFELGLLMNFNAPLLKDGLRRVILNQSSDPQSSDPELGVLASWRFQSSDEGR